MVIGNGGNGSMIEPQTRYREIAGQIVGNLVGQGPSANWSEAQTMAEIAFGRVAQQGVLELRQTLAEMSAYIQRTDRASGAAARIVVPRELVQRFAQVLERANLIVGTLLDRDAIIRSMIQIRAEEVQLGDLFREVLVARGLLLGEGDGAFTVDAVQIQGDAAKLTSVLEHLLDRFDPRARPGARTVGYLKDLDDAIEAFVGQTGGGIPAQTLMEDIVAPLSLGDLAMDTPFARAIVERHGGTLAVARTEQGVVGLRIRLPKQSQEET